MPDFRGLGRKVIHWFRSPASFPLYYGFGSAFLVIVLPRTLLPILTWMGLGYATSMLILQIALRRGIADSVVEIRYKHKEMLKMVLMLSVFRGSCIGCAIPLNQQTPGEAHHVHCPLRQWMDTIVGDFEMPGYWPKPPKSTVH